MNVVADSSTLILMSKITLTKKICDYKKILIPKSVFREVVEEGKKSNKEDAIVVENLVKEDRIKVKNVDGNKIIRALMENFKINNGEAEAIALSLKEKSSLLTDDREAIKVCKVYDISFTTALAFLVKLAKDKKIDKKEALMKIEKLKNIGYYSIGIINNAIQECE